VETVNQRMADLQKTGGMRDMNDEFKQARKAETVVRYQDFLHAKKMAMLKELPGDAAAAAASLRQVANGHRWRYLPAMDWIGWIRGLISAALQWFEAHPGTASWLEAVGSITAIVFVYLFALFQGRRTRSHESTDRIRRAQGLALVLIPALTAFRPKIEMAIIQESKPAPPDEIVHLLDQLYVLGLAGGLILQMVAVLQANQRAELPPNENENARSSYNSIARQRLGDALRYCDDAIYALMKLTRVRTA
jgi:hypothetical protein